jgi:hypothetical protein
LYNFLTFHCSRRFKTTRRSPSAGASGKQDK